MRFATHVRIEAAKIMLTQTTERIGDIAVLIGFSDVISFSGAFKRHVGQSPKNYRQRAGWEYSQPAIGPRNLP